MSESRCYFGFSICCSGRLNVCNDIAIIIFRKLNVRWKDCIVEPPNIYIWKDIEVSFSNKDKFNMNIWMDDLKSEWQRKGKIRELYWWYEDEK